MSSKQPIIINKRLLHLFSGSCLTGILLLASALPACAQKSDMQSAVAFDTLIILEQDTIDDISVIKKHSPRKAVIYSLICPGLGQVYNKKYWKLPIIYGAGGAFAYYMVFNQSKYKKFRAAYNDNEGAEKYDEFLIDGQPFYYYILPLGRDYYRRYRDISVFGLGAIYLLTIVDAMIDAHFFNFDVSEDLSMRIEPALIEGPGITASVGFRINLGF